MCHLLSVVSTISILPAWIFSFFFFSEFKSKVFLIKNSYINLYSQNTRFMLTLIIFVCGVGSGARTQVNVSWIANSFLFQSDIVLPDHKTALE